MNELGMFRRGPVWVVAQLRVAAIAKRAKGEPRRRRSTCLYLPPHLPEHEQLMVADQHLFATFSYPVKALARLRTSGAEVSETPHPVNPRSSDLIRYRLESLPVRMNVRDDCDASHHYSS